MKRALIWLPLILFLAFFGLFASGLLKPETIVHLTTPPTPGDQSYAQVRPLVLLALAGVIVFFVLLVLTGAAFAIRLKADENTARLQALYRELAKLDVAQRRPTPA